MAPMLLHFSGQSSQEDWPCTASALPVLTGREHIPHSVIPAPLITYCNGCTGLSHTGECSQLGFFQIVKTTTVPPHVWQTTAPRKQPWCLRAAALRAGMSSACCTLTLAVSHERWLSLQEVQSWEKSPCFRCLPELPWPLLSAAEALHEQSLLYLMLLLTLFTIPGIFWQVQAEKAPRRSLLLHPLFLLDAVYYLHCSSSSWENINPKRQPLPCATNPEMWANQE